MTDTPAPSALETLGPSGRQGLEAILFLADEPVGEEALAEALEVEPDVVARAAGELAAAYEREHRGMAILQVAGGWRMYASPRVREPVERWFLAGRNGRLTQAALETLAVIAYKQPISRQRIGDIRGVSADAAVRNLVARGLVEEVGRDHGPGQAVLYGTTTLLLERLGIDALEDLPPLTDYLPDAPAPDEPELGALREIRRRLAEAGQRAPEEPGDDLLPPPRTARREKAAGDMESLADRLEEAASSAMDHLRGAVAAQRAADEAAGEATGAEGHDAPEDDDDA